MSTGRGAGTAENAPRRPGKTRKISPGMPEKGFRTLTIARGVR